MQYAFAIPFMREAIVGYLLALPALLVCRWLGLRSVVGYMLVASLAVSPVALFLFTPRVSAMFASEEELMQGTQWASVFTYVVLAATTGWLFSYCVLRKSTSWVKSSKPLASAHDA